MEKEIQEKAVKLFWKYYNDSNNNVVWDEYFWVKIENREGETICRAITQPNRDDLRLVFKDLGVTVLDQDIIKLFNEQHDKIKNDMNVKILNFLNNKLGDEA